MQSIRAKLDPSLASAGTTNSTVVSNKSKQNYIQIPTRIPEKIVVALFSGILVISGTLVVAG